MLSITLQSVENVEGTWRIVLPVLNTRTIASSTGQAFTATEIRCNNGTAIDVYLPEGYKLAIVQFDGSEHG